MYQTSTPFSRKDLIVKESIKIKHDIENILANIIPLCKISELKELDEKTKADNLYELNKEIYKFWQRIDEIGFLSKANLIDKTVMVYLFKTLQDTRLKTIESLFVKKIYDGCITTFAKEHLKISNTDNIKTLEDIDIKICGKFVKETYPLIWHFVKNYYKEPLSKKLLKIKKSIKNYYSKIYLIFAK
jgi:hypothetical protein